MSAQLSTRRFGWKLSNDRLSITFMDGFDAGMFEMRGTRDLNFYQISQIKRVRVVRPCGWLLCSVLCGCREGSQARVHGQDSRHR